MSYNIVVQAKTVDNHLVNVNAKYLTEDSFRQFILNWMAFQDDESFKCVQTNHIDLKTYLTYDEVTNLK